MTETPLLSPGGTTPRTPRLSERTGPMAKTAIISGPSALTEGRANG
jgi:hypothetical protein